MFFFYKSSSESSPKILLRQRITGGLSRTLFLIGSPLLLALASCSQRQVPPEETATGASSALLAGARTVTILGATTGVEQAQLEATFAPFEDATGITVLYEGTDAFTTLLPVRVDSGDSPDIAMFPQPGLMKSLAKENALIPLTDVFTREELSEYYPDSWIDLSTVNDQIYGIWYRAAVKSLVWYVPEEFEKNGYEIPGTWDEMTALSEQMIDDGNTPWCLAMSSGNASGWVGTDWIEEILLRTAGPAFYEKWVEHEVPFDSPEVIEAFEYFGAIARSPDQVWGGKTGVLSIAWGDSPAGLFDEPPVCMMHRQGNFISAFFPDDVELGKDVDFFPTPDINPEYAKALLVGGDIVSMLNDTPEARQLMAYLITPEPHEMRIEEGNFLSANKKVDLSVYPNDISRKQAEVLTSAEVVQFDASDAMPGAVGTGTFWSGVMDFVAGSSAKDVTQQIEYYWPEEEQAEAVAE
ncbi:MAG: ABC transporter substrate-binding protein [Cyanobacteria bacterium J06597_16]